MPIYTGNPASTSYADQVAQEVANDLAADIAALNNGSTHSTLGVGGATPTASNVFAVDGGSMSGEAATDDFTMYCWRATATDVARFTWGENGTDKVTLGLEGGDNLVGTISTDGITFVNWITVAGSSGRISDFKLVSQTVANLGAATTAGTLKYASDGRKAGEGAAAGTGVLVFSDGSNWIAVDTGATVAA